MQPQRLNDVAPELVAELEQLLSNQGETALVEQVKDLTLVDRCRCGDSFCGTFYTAPRPVGAFGPGHYTIALSPAEGMLNLDIVEATIVQVEVLYRDGIRDKILAAVP